MGSISTLAVKSGVGPYVIWDGSCISDIVCQGIVESVVIRNGYHFLELDLTTNPACLTPETFDLFFRLITLAIIDGAVAHEANQGCSPNCFFVSGDSHSATWWKDAGKRYFLPKGWVESPFCFDVE